MARIAGVSKQQSDEKIMAAAVSCMATLGDKGTTFQSIAAKAGVSAGLVVIYFGTRDQIYPKILDHVISGSRAETAKSIQAVKTPTEQLRAYYLVSIDFFRKTSEHAKIYLLLYQFASFDPDYRAQCTEIKEFALRRIEGILTEGKRLGEFTALENIPLAARFIHNSLNGLLISLITNDQKNPDAVLLQQFESVILKMLKE
jgi:AcrR family transcriptional regulator